MEAELERAIHKKFAAEAKAKLIIFAVVGLAQLDEFACVAELDAGVDWVNNGVDIQMGIALD